MSRVLKLAAAGALALSAFYAGGPDTLAAHEAPAVRDADGVVKSLSVLPATGYAVVVIGVEGAVDLQDFTLRSPDKIVVDISGVSLGMPQAGYDKIERGGIVDVRYSQYRRNVVRVVLTLDRTRDYSVSRTERQIRIAVKGDSARTFTAWHTVTDAAPGAVSSRTRTAPPTDSYDEPEVITAGNPSTLQAPMFEAASSPAPRPAFQQRSQQPRITVAWQQANIRDVIAAFAGFSGRTIIVASTVPQTQVNAEIYDQPWDVAMAAILAAHGLAATEDPSGILIVDTFQNIAARQAVERLETTTIRLNYSRAAAVAASVRERLSRDCPASGVGAFTAAGGEQLPPTTTVSAAGQQCPARGTVTVDTLTNAISITDIPSNLAFLAGYARELDVRQPQVAIKAKIILVDRTSLEALGLKYDIGTRQQFFNELVPRLDTLGQPRTGPGQILLGGNTLSAIANASATIPAAALRLVYSTALGNFDFTTFLEALQETSLLDVQSEPSIVTLNNRTATLRAGTEVPIRVIESGAGAAGPEGNFPRATVDMRQTGIVLSVTPTITANRQVQMVVHAENSDVDFRGGDVGAVFPTQAVSNELLVADGETAVMGGLTQTRVSISRSGIPILVDLPLIGRLFGVTQRNESKRDLLILITPHIVDEGQLVPDPVR